VERRQRDRLRTHFTVAIQAPNGYFEAHGINANRHGVGLDSPEPIEPGSLVFLQLPQCGLAGFAYVRHCLARPDGRFTIGLRFRGSLYRERRPEFGGRWHYVKATHGACGAWDGCADA
jgi:hypothetical protein